MDHCSTTQPVSCESIPQRWKRMVSSSPIRGATWARHQDVTVLGAGRATNVIKEHKVAGILQDHTTQVIKVSLSLLS